MKIHNDLSGKEWIPGKIFGPNGEGFYQDVPRRLRISTKHFGNWIIGSRTVAWLPILGAMPWEKWYWWWFISWRPNKRKPGLLVRRYPHLYRMRSVRCIGYDEDGKEFKCTNEAGTKWTSVWCAECDERRRARITGQLENLLEKLRQKGK